MYIFLQISPKTFTSDFCCLGFSFAACWLLPNLPPILGDLIIAVKALCWLPSIIFFFVASPSNFVLEYSIPTSVFYYFFNSVVRVTLPRQFICRFRGYVSFLNHYFLQHASGESSWYHVTHCIF